MSNIQVVYFSGYGHTKRVAEAVTAGADAIPDGDIETARQYGARVAAIAKRLG